MKSEQQDCSAGVYEWGACSRYYNSRTNTDRWTDRVDTIGHQYVLPEETQIDRYSGYNRTTVYVVMNGEHFYILPRENTDR